MLLSVLCMLLFYKMLVCLLIYVFKSLSVGGCEYCYLFYTYGHMNMKYEMNYYFFPFSSRGIIVEASGLF